MGELTGMIEEGRNFNQSFFCINVTQLFFLEYPIIFQTKGHIKHRN